MTRSVSEEKRILMDAYGIERILLPTKEREEFYAEAIRLLGDV